MSTLFGKKRKATKVGASPTNFDTVEDDRRITTPDVGKDDQRHHSNRFSSVAEVDAIDGEGSVQVKVKTAAAAVVSTSQPPISAGAAAPQDFEEMKLADPLIETCKALGYSKPTPVQQTIIPFLLENKTDHVLALAATGTGKTAAFVLPILHHLSMDPYGIFAVIVSPTRELAAQIYQQVLALGSQYSVRSCLVIGGVDATRQSSQLDQKPHIVVATPGRLAELLRGPSPPHLANVRYLVLDEADRLLSTENISGGNGFERDVAELVLHCNKMRGGGGRRSSGRKHVPSCQTLLFSATMTKSLESLQEIASGLGSGSGNALKKFVIRSQKKTIVEKIASATISKSSASEDEMADGSGADNEEDEEDNDDVENNKSTLPSLPAGLRQEYVFMPSRVRDAYLLAVIRTLVVPSNPRSKNRVSDYHKKNPNKLMSDLLDQNDEETGGDAGKVRSAIVFVSTCQRCALVSEILSQVGIANVSLHSLLSQNRRLAALAKFKSHHVRVCVATDLAARGLDIPTVDLVINAELPRNPISYVHRIGRTARAGQRGRAINLVSENDVSLVHAAETTTGKKMDKCMDISDSTAIQMLGSVTKAARLAKMKLSDIGFDELVKKNQARKVAEKKERRRIERALKKQKLM